MQKASGASIWVSWQKSDRSHIGIRSIDTCICADETVVGLGDGERTTPTENATGFQAHEFVESLLVSVGNLSDLSFGLGYYLLGYHHNIAIYEVKVVQDKIGKVRPYCDIFRKLTGK
jgi:hypothetical protein